MKKFRRPLVLIILALAFLASYLGYAAFKARDLFPQLPLLNSDASIRAKLGLHSWVPWGQVSPLALDAIVISEDDDFYHNRGYELGSIKDALKTDIRSFGFKRGGSTITQQVIKNVFLSREKSLRRKVEELVLAGEAEKSINKNRLLEVYVNTAQFGPELYGIKDAASAYFNKTPLQLTAKEGAFLAMLLPSPVRYARSFSDRKLTPYAQKTIDTLLKRMVSYQKLTPQEGEVERSTPLSFENPPPVPSPIPEIPADSH
jgi:monofunctional biosynthetic peptidoglycan transglycosylase